MDRANCDVSPLLLSIREAALTLGVCERTVWTLARERSLPTVRIGRRVMFSRNSLEAWIARQEAAGQ